MAMMERHRIRAARGLSLLTGLLFFFLVAGTALAAVKEEPWPQFVQSADGVPISYTVYGSGEPTLLFVHGWSADSRYWRQQLAHFKGKYRLITMDLAGHGHSGMNRERYGMQAFGEDVAAVIKATDSKAVILVGHSMGGFVIAEAAKLAPDQVIGLIGVDTLQDVEHKMTQKELDEMLTPFEEDFASEARKLVDSMLSNTAPEIRGWILADVAAAPPCVAGSALEELLGLYTDGRAAQMFETIKVPVICVNGDMIPVNQEGNARHMQSFQAITVRDADHFLMLDRPWRFNKALESAVYSILRQTASAK
ncbi:MAG: alpha/beta fold hydrolase [Desulfobulbus sp.]